MLKKDKNYIGFYGSYTFYFWLKPLFVDSVHGLKAVAIETGNYPAQIVLIVTGRYKIIQNEVSKLPRPSGRGL